MLEIPILDEFLYFVFLVQPFLVIDLSSLHLH